MTDHKRLDGKVAIITGGASGMGEESSRKFVDHGALVVIADIQDEKGQNLAASIGCTYIHCDVSDEDQVEKLVESTVQLHNRLDIMFSHAGIIGPNIKTHKQQILDFDMSRYENLFSVNVRGTVVCVKHAARAMVRLGIKGSVICTGSVVATNGTDVATDYTMSKHAVLGLVRCASRQLGKYGIRVNCVSPGAVATPGLCDYWGKSEEEVEGIFEPSSCLKGVLKARHVVDAVVFLASDESEFVSGHDLVVDGVRIALSAQDFAVK